MVTEQLIRDAYIFLRQNNNTIPDETIDFMFRAALDKFREIEKIASLPLPSLKVEQSKF